MKQRPVRSLFSCLAVLALMAPAAHAQTFPSKPIRVIVGFAPGGSNDIIARLLAPELAKAFGQQVVVENRPGASGSIAASAMLSSPADGHTIWMCTSGNFSIQPHLGQKMSFDPEADIQPVTQIANAPYLLLVNNNLPVKSVKELVDLAKTKPGALNFASSGNGTGGHLAGEMLKVRANIDMVHIAYKGTGQAMNDVVGGQVSLIFDQPVSSMPFVKAGKLRALAVASPRRLAGLPDYPTVEEQGVPDFDPVSWTGFCAAKGVPTEAVSRIQSDVAKVLRIPEIRDRLVQDGLEPIGSTPREFSDFMAVDKKKWGEVIRQAGVKAE